MTLNRRIRSIVNSQVETKVLTANITETSHAGTDFGAWIARIPLGTNPDQRVGQYVYLKGIDINFSVINTSATQIGAVRVAVTSLQSDEAPVVPVNPWDALSPFLTFTPKSVKRWYLFPIDSGQESTRTFRYRQRFPGNGHKVKFDQTGNVLPAVGGYYLTVTSTFLAAGTMEIKGYYRYWYKDA